MNIFLIGFRCTGKTTVGRILAKSMSLRFVDTDDVIVGKLGQSIRAVVVKRGWNHFRRWETKIMAEVCADDGQVVGTGGGVILDPENIAAMNRNGAVVWLKANPETIVRRMEIDHYAWGFRPSLTGKPASIEVGEVLPQREPLYGQAADIEVVTDNMSPQMVAGEIVQVLASMEKDGMLQRKRGHT